MSAQPSFRLAQSSDLPTIWEIIQFAIAQRKKEGSNQWQNGYPNPDVLAEDIRLKKGYVWVIDKDIALYVAVSFSDEQAYEHIKGQWLSEGDYLVFHRIAMSPQFFNQGLSHQVFKAIESLALKHGVYSIKVDTNFDNHAMLHLLKMHDYQHCGEVLMHGEPRMAFEKLLSSKV